MSVALAFHQKQHFKYQLLIGILPIKYNFLNTTITF